MQHMKDIRIGNDILVTWSLFRGEEAYDLTDLPLTLYLSNAYGKKKVKNFSVDGNKVQWTFHGKDQKNTGKYSLILVVNEGELGMQSTDVCDFVQLVSCSCQALGSDEAGVQTETIQLTSEVDFPPIVIDSELSETSANPVQNAAVTKAINALKNSSSATGAGEYELEFDIVSIYGGDVEVPCNYNNLKEAIESGKTIVAKAEKGFSSKYVCSAELSDDTNIYIGIPYYYAHITIVIPPESEKLYDGNISIQPLSNIPSRDEFATINGQSILNGGNIVISGGEGGSSGTYESNIEDGSISMTEEYGDFKVGTTVESLNGKTYDELFDGILFPTVNPTFTAPSASIAWKNYAATQEVGATGPTANNFTTSYNAGAITLSGKWQNNRGGEQNTANSFIYVNGNVANRTLPSKVTLGNTTFKYRAAYAQGPQPKNNKGNNYDSPLAAGSVDSGEIKLNGTYPWYASTQTAGVLTKQALIAWNATDGAMQAGATGVGFEVKPHTAAAPQKFKLPRKATSLQMYNTVAKAFETVALSDWDETTSQDTINGNTRTYYTYTYKGDARGSVTLIVKF